MKDRSKLAAWGALTALGAAATALGSTSSCFVQGFEMAAGGAAPTPTTGAAGGSDAGAGPCAHARWPSPPSSSDPGDDDLDLVLVARSVDFGETDLSDGPLVGYDLDNFCTCQGDADSCRVPDWATADHCDGPEGRDNAIAQLFARIGLVDDDFTSAVYTEAAESGRDSMIIRIREYNGQPNDEQVTVSLHPSYGVDDDPCNSAGSTAAWDGTDRWPINAPSLNDPGADAGAGGASCGSNGYDVDDARYIDTHAFVANGVVVASLPEFPLEFTSGSASLPVQLVAGFVTGRLSQEGSQWALRDGLLVGRWPLARFFEFIGGITHEHEPFCTDHALYPMLKGELCRFPDIAAALSGPTTPCDALSFAMAVEAFPAQIGSVLPSRAKPRACPPETDPMSDSCETP